VKPIAMSRTKVSVVIVARNEAKNIEKCVGGIFSQNGDWEIDVVLVDSESNDGTPQLAKKWPICVHGIRRHEFHHGRTRNLGASMTKGDYIVFLQGDAWGADDEWLSRLLQPFQEGPHIGAVYGKQLPKSDCDPVNSFRTRWNYQDSRIDKSLKSRSNLGHRLYFFSTANCVIRREVWERFRFPEDIRIFEDTTFAKSLIQAGLTIVYHPTAAVVHSHNLGARAIFKRYLDMGYVQRKYAFTENLGGSYRSEGVRYVNSGIRAIQSKAGLLWVVRFLIHTGYGYVGLTWGRMLNRMGFPLR